MAARIAAVTAALLAGPPPDRCDVPLPSSIEVGMTHLDAAGVAYLELRSPEGERPPESGSQVELLRIYSLVNTVQANVPGVRAVALLWNGRQLISFSGHVDTSRPLSADPKLVRSSGR